MAEGSTELSMFRHFLFLPGRKAWKDSQALKSCVRSKRNSQGRAQHCTDSRGPCAGCGSAAFPPRSEFTVVAYEQLGGEAQAPAGRVS